MRKQLNVRVPEVTLREIEELAQNFGYESQSHVVIAAVARLHQSHTEVQMAEEISREEIDSFVYGDATIHIYKLWMRGIIGEHKTYEATAIINGEVVSRHQGTRRQAKTAVELEVGGIFTGRLYGEPPQ